MKKMKRKMMDPGRVISKAARKRAEESFVNMMEANKIKWESKTYLREQYYFFSGAMCALDAVCPYWFICLNSGREILKEPCTNVNKVS